MSVATFDRAQWLKDRKSGIGASEVATILGLNPYASPWDVWADKMDIIENWEGNEATELGTRFEPAILDFAESRLGTLERNVRLVHPTLPLASTLDARLVSDGTPVEAKTTGLCGPVYGEWGEEGSDIVPDCYSIQVHTQIFCSEKDMGYLFALIPGRGITRYEIPRSDRICELIGNFVADWWEKHIVGKTPPSSDKASIEVVKRLKKVPNRVVILPDHADDLLVTRETLKEEIKALNEQLENINKNLLIDLGDAEEGVCPMTGMSVSYYQQHAKGYTVEPKSYRVLRVHKPKKGSRR